MLNELLPERLEFRGLLSDEEDEADVTIDTPDELEDDDLDEDDDDAADDTADDVTPDEQ